MTSSPSHLSITSMKNEASFILEWVAFHRTVGFTDFLVYTNDCDDCTVDLLLRLQDLGVVTHEANKVLRRGPHKSALKAAKSHPLVKAADWILVSDIDEFLVVKVGDGTVQALVDHVPADTDVIPVTWRLFSHNGHVAFVDAPVIEQFTDAERSVENGGFPDRFVKCLFRQKDGIERFGIHGPKTPAEFVWRQPDGRQLGPDDNLTRPKSDFAYEAAQINHYAVGAVDSFLVKKDRGRANHWRQDLGLDYWRRLCRGGETDMSILAKLDATKAEMDRLLADQTLKSLHDEAVAWRKARVEALRRQPQFEEMREQILELSDAGAYRQGARTKKRTSRDQQFANLTTDEAMSRLEAMCGDMRVLVNQLTPFELAEAALDRLDDIEKGLFGKVPGG